MPNSYPKTISHTKWFDLSFGWWCQRRGAFWMNEFHSGELIGVSWTVAGVSAMLPDTVKTDICNDDGSMEDVWFHNKPVGWPKQPPNQPPIITKTPAVNYKALPSSIFPPRHCCCGFCYHNILQAFCFNYPPFLFIFWVLNYEFQPFYLDVEVEPSFHNHGWISINFISRS